MDDFIAQLLTVFLGSGAAFAVIQLVLEHRRNKQVRADAVEYLALQLAFQLEGFSIRCADAAADHRTASDSDGHAGRHIGEVPQPEPYPESDGYKLLDRAILNDLLDFPQRCRMAEDAAMFWWNVVGDEDCCSNALLQNTIEVGNRALDIARRLRRRYKIGERVLKFGKWDIAEFFEEEISKIEKQAARQRELDMKIDPAEMVR